MKKHFLFAALFLVALAFGFVGCENPDDESGISIEKPDNNKTENTTNNSNNDGEEDKNNTTPTEPMLVATSSASDIEYSSVTLWGRLNTDTLVFLTNVEWGIECSTSKEEMQSHKGKKALCTTDLVGENSDEYTVTFKGLDGGKMLYYNAYLVINNMKYIYGEIDSVHLDVKLTVNKNQCYGTVTGSGTYDYGTELIIKATPNFGFKFLKWNDGNTDDSRTITINQDITYIATFEVIPMEISGTKNGYAYVNLGLPSGLKWATCNVGATKPEEYGNYYAWGETSPKSSYTESNHTYTTGSNLSEWYYATINMGSDWRMPTKKQQQELLDECIWTWTTDYNGTGVAGEIVTSKTNGNHIFLPAAGWYDNSELENAGITGIYWSKSQSSIMTSAATISFASSGIYSSGYFKYMGCSVRGVCW